MLSQGRLLLGAFSESEAAATFGGRVSTLPADWFRERWPVARAAFLSAPASAPRSVEPPSDITRRRLAEVLEAPLFRAALDGRDWRVEEHSIADLVIFQPLINLERVSVMRQLLTDNGLLNTLYPLTTTLEVETAADKNPTVSFTSSRSDLAVSAAEVRRLPESGALEVAFRIEPRPNYVSLLSLDGRFLLRNGYHRLAALLCSGLSSAPFVVIEGNIESLGPHEGLTADVLTGLRPPVFADLAEGGPSSVEIELRPRRHRVSVRVFRETLYEES